MPDVDEEEEEEVILVIMFLSVGRTWFDTMLHTIWSIVCGNRASQRFPLPLLRTLVHIRDRPVSFFIDTSIDPTPRLQKKA